MGGKTVKNSWQSLFLSEAVSRHVNGVKRDRPYLQWRTGLWQVLRCELAWPNDLPVRPNICFPSHALTSENERDALLRRCRLLCWPYLLFIPWLFSLYVWLPSRFGAFSFALLCLSTVSVLFSGNWEGCNYNHVVSVSYHPLAERTVVTAVKGVVWRL